MSEPRPDREEELLPGVEYPAESFALQAGVAALRERLWRETSQVVRGRQRRKRALRIAGWGLAYAAGVLSAWFGLRQITAAPGGQSVVATQPAPETKSIATAAKSAPPSQRRRVTPEELRARVAGAKRDQQIELLRRAGDLYLRERNDLRSAVMCYQQVLELAETPEQLAVLPDDSWLLAELKNAQRTQ